MSAGATLVSVIVPTRDRPALLCEALASIRALETDALTFEILVGDNGNDPASRAAADAYRAIWMKVERAGAGAARNAGLNAATGEFIAFLDDDDVWLPANIVNHLALLRARPELEGVFGQIVTTDMDLKPGGEPWPQRGLEGDKLVAEMLSGYYPQLGGTFVRASVAKDIGLFDETLMGDQDWDWQLRLARRRKTGFTPTPSVLFRQRPPGSFDKLRLTRLGFARKVFLRHALAEWRVFGNPLAMTKSYTLTMRQYFDYFVEAAVSRAAIHDRGGARAAIGGAFRVFPMRTMAHLVLKPRLRGAALGAMTPWGAKRPAGAI
ncbi:MAG: glycosyltransferase family 2 protein [Hyphomonadaceae bacterium]